MGDPLNDKASAAPVVTTLLLLRLFVAGIVVVWAPYSIVSAHGVAVGISWLTVTGAVLIGVGAVGYVCCAWDFARFGGAEPKAIIVRGVYARVRHPMYASLALILFGECMIFR